MENYDKILIDEFELTKRQLTQFKEYFLFLDEWNQKMNLTAIKDEKNVYHKHFLDSLMLAKFTPLNAQSILDVGSGAGFPSIPLKILHPGLKITIIDSLKKRIHFLKQLCQHLDLDVELIHGRVETHNKRDYYDIVTARAVAKLNKLCELCLPFVKQKGKFYAYKGSQFKEEIAASSKALNLLDSEIVQDFKYSILGENRVVIEIVKNKITDHKYPREFKKIKAKPL